MDLICPKCRTKIRILNSLVEPLIQSRVQQSLTAALKDARREAQGELELRLREKELQLAGLRQQIETLRQRATQGSEQLQGEAQEEELGTVLGKAFPRDVLQPVPKGRIGADILQSVRNASGQCAGSILWECKATRTWSPAWLGKLREDQRQAKAEVAVLASRTLPGHLHSFELIDGVWIAHPKYAVPLASALRHLLIEISNARRANRISATAGERLIRYISSHTFRQHVERIAEQFAAMKNDLERERAAATRAWAKREAQIHKAMESTVALYGQLQAAAESQVTEICSNFRAACIGALTE